MSILTGCWYFSKNSVRTLEHTERFCYVHELVTSGPGMNVSSWSSFISFCMLISTVVSVVSSYDVLTTATINDLRTIQMLLHRIYLLVSIN